MLFLFELSRDMSSSSLTTGSSSILVAFKLLDILSTLLSVRFSGLEAVSSCFSQYAFKSLDEVSDLGLVFTPTALRISGNFLA